MKGKVPEKSDVLLNNTDRHFLSRDDSIFSDQKEEEVEAIGWIQSKRQVIRTKKRSKSKKFLDEQVHASPGLSPTPSSSAVPDSSSPHYWLQQNTFLRIMSPASAEPDHERLRLKERKMKYSLNSYLTLSLDSAEESIHLHDASNSNISSKAMKKKLSKASSRSPMNPESRKRSHLLRSSSNDSSSGRKISESGDGVYYYKSRSLPSTHEQHLIHSPYYRALFGNTAALPEEPDAETANYRIFSADSSDSIIAKGKYGNQIPRLRTLSQDSSNTSASSTSSSSSDEEQEQVLRRSHSSTSLQSKRLNLSHSSSNNNLRRAIFNAATMKPSASVPSHQPNQTSGEEDDSESSKEEKETHQSQPDRHSPEFQQVVTEVSNIMGESWPALPSLPLLSIDTSNKPNNYDDEYPSLRSPKTASQLLLESKGLQSPKSAAIPSPRTASKLSIITGIQEFMASTATTPNLPSASTPSSHQKVIRSPRMFEITSATKKRITTWSEPYDSPSSSRRKVISLNAEGEETTLISPKQSFTSPGLVFRTDLSNSFFFSPANVVPAIAAHTSSLSSSPFYPATSTPTSISLSSPFTQGRERTDATTVSEEVSPVSARYPLFTSPSVESMKSISHEEDKEEEESLVTMSQSFSHSQEDIQIYDEKAEQLQQHNEESLGFLKTPSKDHSQMNQTPLLTIRQRTPIIYSSSLTDLREKGDEAETKSLTATVQEKVKKEAEDMPPAIPLTRQSSLNETSRVLVDKLKLSRFLYTKLIGNMIPILPPSSSVSTTDPIRIRRWDDPDSESDEEPDEEKAQKGSESSVYDKLVDLITEYSPSGITLEMLEEKKQKKYFLLENPIYAIHYNHYLDDQQRNLPSIIGNKSDLQQRKQQLKASQLVPEEIDFLWFHKLVVNYLQEENSHYFLSLFNALSGDEIELEEGENPITSTSCSSFQENIHKICQYLLSSHFYYYLLAQLPEQDPRFHSRIYEFCKLLYVHIHQQEMQRVLADPQQLEEGEEAGPYQENLKLQYLKNLAMNYHHHQPTSCSSLFNSSHNNSSDSYDSCDSSFSYTSFEGEPLKYREVPVLLLEALLTVSQERSLRCQASCQQSYRQEVDVNFIAQKGFLNITSTTTAGITHQVDQSIKTHYSLQSIIQTKEERPPFRIHDSDYYLLEYLKYLIKYEFEYLVDRLARGVYEITLVIKNLITMKYLTLTLFELIKGYGYRLGSLSELVEQPSQLQLLLDLIDSLCLFYQLILIEVDCIDNLIVLEAMNLKDQYVEQLLQHVYQLIASTTDAFLNSHNVYYLFLQFLQQQWKSSMASSTAEHNYAQEILYVRMFFMILQYLPPESLLFPTLTCYDTIVGKGGKRNKEDKARVINNEEGKSEAGHISLPTAVFKTMTMSEKLLQLIHRLFHKVLQHLSVHQHFKVIQTICQLLLLPAILPTAANNNNNNNSNNNSSSSSRSILADYFFPKDFTEYLDDLRSASTTSITTSPTHTIGGRTFQTKQQEVQRLQQGNDDRLTLLVQQLRHIRQEYWNPMMKGLVHQVLDMIYYYQMILVEGVEDEEETED